MSKAQDNLKSYIDKIDNEETIEKIRIYLMGILTQQGLEHKQDQSQKSAGTEKKPHGFP